MFIRILVPQPSETVHDPTCGSGGRLVHSAAFPRKAAGPTPREIFTSSHALASPADEAGRFRVMVKVEKADA